MSLIGSKARTLLILGFLAVGGTARAHAEEKQKFTPASCGAKFMIAWRDWNDPTKGQWNRASSLQLDWWFKKGVNQFPGLCLVKNLDEADWTIVWSDTIQAQSIEVVVPKETVETKETGRVELQGQSWDWYGNTLSTSATGTYSGSSTSTVYEKQEKDMSYRRTFTDLRPVIASNGKRLLGIPVFASYGSNGSKTTRTMGKVFISLLAGGETAVRAGNTWQKNERDGLEDSLKEITEWVQGKRKPRLGLLLRDIRPEDAYNIGLSEAKGILVVSVDPASAAERAGFQVGDVIFEVNNPAIKKAEDVPKVINVLPPGSATDFSIRRKQEILHLVFSQYPALNPPDRAQIQNPGEAKHSETPPAVSKQLQKEPSFTAPVSAATPAAPQQAEPATVVINSTPDRAGITIDGKFVGSTPSTMQLTPGEHEVIIHKIVKQEPTIMGITVAGGKLSVPSYKDWKRTLTVNPGSTITIDATLEKAN